eukprot:NODE_399_length_9361_cov_0.420428.p4 type:complete len:181 gc:universal NODE_399_length_9361_cov_0.420428:3423-3965(+)
MIDSLNIKEIALQELRGAITMIPQDPALFMGSIRQNLDLFEEYDDWRLNDVLKRVNLNCNLDDSVKENGYNLSVGMKQQLNLARAILKQSKLLIMDEATANIDTKTDEHIQKMIRTEFKDSTIICIAHRLRTIIDFDKVLVMDAGKVIEYDSPRQLLQNKGLFYNMCMESNEYSYLSSRL